uniref:Phlebovirus glycoprotein G2 fusion domain-containing protein n=1 Tax=Angiostrongylus cantonensis TaxID=6313 RepID=A0A0K0D2M3_ANGCA
LENSPAFIEIPPNTLCQRLLRNRLYDRLGKVEDVTCPNARNGVCMSSRLIFESEQIEQLQIDRDVWRCKFLAQSIHTDELTFRMEVLIGISATSITNTEAQYFANLDLHKFLTRSPCEKRIRRKGPNYSNVTISCCPKCSGREIHLL